MIKQIRVVKTKGKDHPENATLSVTTPNEVLSHAGIDATAKELEDIGKKLQMLEVGEENIVPPAEPEDIDTQESRAGQQIEEFKCFLCRRRFVWEERETTQVEETIKNLFEIMDISAASVQKVWSSVPEFKTFDWNFCNDCDAAIDYGIDLKRNLRYIRNYIENNIHRGGRSSGSDTRSRANVALMMGLQRKEERIPAMVLKLISQCFLGCQVRITKDDTVRSQENYYYDANDVNERLELETNANTLENSQNCGNNSEFEFDLAKVKAEENQADMQKGVHDEGVLVSKPLFKLNAGEPGGHNDGNNGSSTSVAHVGLAEIPETSEIPSVCRKRPRRCTQFINYALRDDDDEEDPKKQYVNNAPDDSGDSSWDSVSEAGDELGSETVKPTNLRKRRKRIRRNLDSCQGSHSAVSAMEKKLSSGPEGIGSGEVGEDPTPRIKRSRRFFTTEEKLAIVQYAEKFGRLEAAKMFSTSQKNVRTWKNQNLEVGRKLIQKQKSLPALVPISLKNSQKEGDTENTEEHPFVLDADDKESLHVESAEFNAPGEKQSEDSSFWINYTHPEDQIVLREAEVADSELSPPPEKRYRPSNKEQEVEIIAKYTCTSCPAIFSSEIILDLHTQEMHGSASEDLNLMFKCDACRDEFAAKDLVNADAAPGERYSAEINGKIQNFANFFQLCEKIHEVCSENKKKSEEEDNSNGVQSIKEINIHGRLEPYTPCVLCRAMYAGESNSMTLHYKYSHGLECCYEDRYCCAYCHEIYVGASPTTGIGMIDFKDVDHFKNFVHQHLHCNETVYPPKMHTCRSCDVPQSFNSPKGLFAHEIQFHSKDLKYNCEACSQVFLDFDALNQHARKFHQVPVRSHCGKCSESFLSRLDYYNHIKVHKGQKTFTCTICDQSLKTIQTYNIHMERKHAQKKINQQPKKHNDSALPQSDSSVLKKRSKNYAKTNDVKNVISCFLCDQQFQNAQVLDLHLRELHETVCEGLKFKCQCGEELKKFDYLVPGTGADNSPEYLYPSVSSSGRKPTSVLTFTHHCDNHVRQCGSQSDGYGLSSMTPSFQCSKCQKRFTSEIVFVSHLQSHYADILKNCILCAFAFSDLKKIDSHMYCTHYLKKVCNQQYYCRYCFACYVPERPDLETGRLVLDELENFKKFAKLHICCKNNPEERVTNFNCKFCSEAFSHPVELFKHEIQKHTQNFAVYCDECQSGYSSVKDLKTHLRQHQEKAFKCDQCPSAFRQKHVLEDHKRRHNNERPFVCHVCAKSFHSTKKLRRHEQTHRETADVPCPTCGKLFRAKHDVENHIYQVHKKGRKSKTVSATTDTDVPLETW